MTQISHILSAMCCKLTGLLTINVILFFYITDFSVRVDAQFPKCLIWKSFSAIKKKFKTTEWLMGDFLLQTKTLHWGMNQSPAVLSPVDRSETSASALLGLIHMLAKDHYWALVCIFNFNARVHTEPHVLCLLLCSALHICFASGWFGMLEPTEAVLEHKSEKRLMWSCRRCVCFGAAGWVWSRLA